MLVIAGLRGGRSRTASMGPVDLAADPLAHASCSRAMTTRGIDGSHWLVGDPPPDDAAIMVPASGRSGKSAPALRIARASDYGYEISSAVSRLSDGPPTLDEPCPAPRSCTPCLKHPALEVTHNGQVSPARSLTHW